MSVPNHPALASHSYKVARQPSHFRFFSPGTATSNTEASEIFRRGACTMKSRRSKLTLCPPANRHIGSKALQPSQFSARDQSQSASNRHRSKRAHPRLPWHSQCPLAGIGCGMECCAWLDAPRFAAKPQVQGRLASGEEFGLSCEYAPAARAIKPNSLARTRSGRLAHSRSVYRERSVVGFAR